MAVYAVENGVVAQIWLDVETVEEFTEKYGEDQTVFEGSATPGQPIVDGVPVAFVPALDQVKVDALSTLKERHAVFLRLLTGDYSDEERDTWAEQKSWAKSYETDPEAAAHLVGMLTDIQHQALVDAGIDPATYMAEKILSKAKAFADHTMTANKLRNVAVEAVEMATTIEQVTEAVAAFEAQSESTLGGQG